MTGVDILATQEVAVDFAFNWTAFWIGWGITVFAGLIFSVITVVRGECDWPFIPAIVCVCAIGGIAIGFSLGECTQRPIEYETQYKVTVSEQVSMTDFLEKYEIISNEGKIYTVREVKGE